jgi:hypothetical protein
MAETRFEFKTGPNKSITLRETNGLDEEKAQQLAAAKGSKGSFQEELIRLSVSKVDDVAVDQPWTGLDEMPSKQRNLIVKGFNMLNAVDPTESTDFLLSAKTTV